MQSNFHYIWSLKWLLLAAKQTFGLCPCWRLKCHQSWQMPVVISPLKHRGHVHRQCSHVEVDLTAGPADHHYQILNSQSRNNYFILHTSAAMDYAKNCVHSKGTIFNSNSCSVTQAPVKKQFLHYSRSSILITSNALINEYSCLTDMLCCAILNSFIQSEFLCKLKITMITGVNDIHILQQQLLLWNKCWKVEDNDSNNHL